MARSYDNASSQATEFVDDTDLRPTTAITVCGWFRPTAFDGNANSFLAGKLRTAFGPSYGIRRSGSDVTYHFAVFIGGLQNSVDSTALTGGNWYFMVGRWQSGGNVELRIYNEDGSLNQSVTSAGTVSGTIEHGAAPFVIGRDMFGYWTGAAERVRLYDTYLSNASIDSIMFATAADTSAKLHAQLTEAGSTEADVSGNNSDGTHINSPTVVAGPDLGGSGQTYEANPSDAASVTDDTIRAAVSHRIQSDSVSLDDSAYVTVERSSSDSIAVADVLGPEVGRSPSDALSVSDSTAREHSASRPSTDSIELSESSAVTAFFERSALDSAAALDDATRTTSYGRVASDTASASDTLGPEVGRSPFDAIAVSDSVSIEFSGISINRSISDDIDVSDDASISVFYGRLQVESIATTEDVDRTAHYGRAASDDESVSDSLAPEVVLTTGDVVSVNDGAASALSYDRQSSDFVATSEATSSETFYDRQSSESIEVSDVTTAAIDRTFVRVASDTLEVSDLFGREHSASRPIADSAVVSEETERLVEYVRVQTDTASVSSDSTDREVTYGRLATDSLSVSDEAFRELAGTSIQDSLVVTDSLFPATDYRRQHNDSVATLDSVSAQSSTNFHAILVQDELEVVDVTYADEFLFPGDAVAISDVLQIQVWYIRTNSDALDAIDFAASGDILVTPSATAGGATSGPVRAYTVS